MLAIMGIPVSRRPAMITRGRWLRLRPPAALERACESGEGIAGLAYAHARSARRLS
jgi:hypothetical protein